MRADLMAAGLDVKAQYGGRCANDVLTDDDIKQDARFYAQLERLELALCDREPFMRTGLFWQLIAEKPPIWNPITNVRTRVSPPREEGSPVEYGNGTSVGSLVGGVT